MVYRRSKASIFLVAKPQALRIMARSV